MIGTGGEGKPGDEEGPGDLGMAGEGQKNEGGMMMGPEGEQGDGPDESFRTVTEGMPGDSFKPGDEVGAPGGIIVPSGGDDFGG